MGKEKEMPCMFCGRELHIPSFLTDKKAVESSLPENFICMVCCNNFAADSSNCFGKQDPATGKALAILEASCKKCNLFKPCAAWPKNTVVFIPPSEDNKKGEKRTMSEKEKTATPPAANPQADKGKKSTAKASGKADGKGKKAATGKGKGAAAATKTESKMVSYGKLQYREGSSAQIAAAVLTAKKEISMEDAVKELKKSGVESDNYEARIGIIFSHLKKAGLVDKKKTDKGTVLFFRK